MALEDILDFIEENELDLEAGDLDEIVYEFKAEEASQINNQGVDGQIEYLMEWYTEPELMDYLESMFG
jgi:hypothetical protein